MDGRTDGGMNGWMHVRMTARAAEAWMDGWDVWMDGQLDGSTDGLRLQIEYLSPELLSVPLPARLLGVHLGLPGSDHCPVAQLALLQTQPSSAKHLRFAQLLAGVCGVIDTGASFTDAALPVGVSLTFVALCTTCRTALLHSRF